MLLTANKISALAIFKAFVNNKFNVVSNMKLVFHKVVDNIVGKGKHIGYQHFLHFPHCLWKAFSSEESNVAIVWWKVEYF